MVHYMESETVELKEKYTDTICREIVAFLNSDGGTIIIGVKDDGTVIGAKEIDDTLRKISDIITMQIEPNPQDEIRTEIKFEAGKTLVFVNVPKGSKNIYCQKKYGFSSNGCVMRIGTTCRAMTPEQIRIRYERNFLEGEYIIRKKSGKADLSFRELKIYYAEKGFHLEDMSFESNLHLKTEKGSYNLLAELLSDNNDIPFNFVKFHGPDKAAISERNNYGYGCILTTYEKIRNRLQAENICTSDTTVRPRIDRYLFDYDCVNEAVLNAIVHNDWTVTEPQISMFSNRMEILSHGGLPGGMTKEAFYEGISRPRNTTLMRIFMNMGLVEHTGHGIPTITGKYGTEVFDITDQYVRCTIPFDEQVLKTTQKSGGINSGINDGINIRLNATEQKLLGLLIDHGEYTQEQMSKEIGVSVRTIERNLSGLQRKGKVERIGSKKNGRWIVVS